MLIPLKQIKLTLYIVQSNNKLPVQIEAIEVDANKHEESTIHCILQVRKEQQHLKGTIYSKS